MDIITKIKKIDTLFHAKGCTEDDIKNAESILNLTFPKEYVSYVKEFGAISFYATEWTGLNVGERINVANVTLKERELNPDFPLDCFVIENQGIDGVITVANSNGEVFTVQHDKITPLCNSIGDYLDICINRENK